MDKKEQTRLRVQRYREKRNSVTKSPESVTQSPDSVTESPDNVTQDVTHPVMKYLIEPELRKKMESIVSELKKHNQLENTWFGCGEHPKPLDIVGEMLEVTS